MGPKDREQESKPAERALDVWLDHLSRVTIGDEDAFERLCLAHGDLAGELRRLRAGVPDQEITSEPASGGEPPPIDEHLRRISNAYPDGSRYLREGEIARGGMGVILRAKDLQLERHLALKVLAHGSVRDHRQAAARFLEEAQVTAQLDHPGIVPVHECGLDVEGRPYFAMKLVHGRNLRQILELVHTRREGWSVTRALGVLLKVCDAMAYAHSKGVLHRDLKPANVMVGNFGEVYVMDWGLARVMGRKDIHDLRMQPQTDTVSLHTRLREEREDTPDSPLITLDGQVIGTPAYMPPEQACGEIDRLSPRSDVYSVGAILYHLLAGAAPYSNEGKRMSAHTILAMVLHGPPARLEERAPRAPHELVAICNKAMAREPDRRYMDMLAMAEDLRDYLEGRVVRAYASGPVAELGKWVRRNKAFAASSSAAILVAVIGILLSSRFRVEAAEKESLAARESLRANEASIAAERSYEQVLRLSDLQELDDLVAESDRLWPVGPEEVVAIEGLLDRAQRLLTTLPEHQEILATLADSETREDRWWRTQLMKLVAGIQALHDPETGLVAGLSPQHGPGLEQRLDFARTIRRRSIESPDAAALWEEAIDAIRASQRYGGLVLVPQLGLLPIGEDLDSGLWEFAHLQSGAPVARDPEGRLLPKVDSGLVLVLIPGGTFWMGDQKADKAQPNFSEAARPQDGPVQQVTLGPFFLSKFEMTQGQWRRLAGENPSEARIYSPFLPVEQVSWIACTELMHRVSLCLPTEEQWEYAARAGTKTTWWTGDDPRSLIGAANIADKNYYDEGGLSTPKEAWLDDGASFTTMVGRYRPNLFGLYDVYGNVSEWCSNSPSYEDDGGPGDATRATPEMPAESREPMRAQRGGNFQSLANEATSALRLAWRGDQLGWDLGLRPARALD